MSWFGGLSGFGGWASGLLGKAGSWLNDNPVAANIASHIIGTGFITDPLAIASAIGEATSGSSGRSDVEKLLIAQALTNNNNQGQTASTTYAEDAAAQDAIDASEAEARGNTTSATDVGVGKAKAGMLGEAAANQSLTSDYADRYSQYKGQGASSQADYLRSIGQTYDLANQLNNAKKGANSAVKFGALSGAVQGAGLGMALSDENNKVAPSSDINNQISEFINLTKRVYDLKKRRNK